MNTSLHTVRALLVSSSEAQTQRISALLTRARIVPFDHAGSAQQALFWQAGKVLLPKGHVFLKPRRSAVRLIFKVGFFAGARLAKFWRFTTCESCVNVRNNSYVKKECQPVQHHVRALHGNDAACLASDDKA